VNGKLRDKVEFSKTSTKEDIQKEVLNLEKVKSIVGDKKIKQFVYVPERLANVVV
jgi:leucyl-tRNA synthetase